jgi:phosphoribosylformylglycinamidine cyclo-ligase
MNQEAYERAGVSQAGADAAVEALVAGLRRAAGDGARTVPLPGHYASVIRLDERTGIAITTDGVGTKLLVAEQLGRWDTVGIDCVAMNVNDLVCVGAEPLAMVDYLAVPTADPEVCGEIGVGLGRGAELAGIEIPGGELAQLGGMVSGPDLSGAAIGAVALTDIVDGARVEPGDAIIGLPASGLHSNGYTLARRALADVPLEDDRLGRPLGDILLEPTEIYVPAVLDLLRSPADVRGLAHITGDGLNNLRRLTAPVGYEILDPLPVPAVFELIAELGDVPEEEMYEVFNMGCGFCCVVAAADADAAVELLRRHYPAAKRIGNATDRAGKIERRAG